MPLLSQSDLTKLEQLALVADRVRVGAMKGDRRSKKRGTSIEFADYRNYVRGDDLRRLDWNVFARLERPFIKLLEEEEDLAVHLLVDASQSMAWPEDEATNKFDYARRLAAALGHMALSSGDLCQLRLLGSEARRWGPFRGRQNTLRLLNFVESVKTGGITDLNLSLREYALRGGRPGLLFLFSDLLSPAGYEDGINALLARGFEVAVLHLLSPDEINPEGIGDVKLIDSETGADAEITLDAATLGLYRERLDAWQAEIATFCRGRHVHYIPISTDVPWDRIVMQTLRAQGVLR